MPRVVVVKLLHVCKALTSVVLPVVYLHELISNSDSAMCPADIRLGVINVTGQLVNLGLFTLSIVVSGSFSLSIAFCAPRIAHCFGLDNYVGLLL